METASTFKEKYWKYGLVAIVLIAGLVLLKETRPYLGGLLAAFTVYVLLRSQLYYLTEKKNWRKSLAALLLVGETIFVFLIPFSLIIWLLIVNIQNIHIDPEAISVPIESFIAAVKEKTGYDIVKPDNISSVVSILPRIAQALIGGIGSFGVNVLVLILILYFMLVGGRKMEQFLIGLLPFKESYRTKVLHETRVLVRSNAIGIPLMALIQGGLATLGFYLFGAPHPVLFGFLTAITTILPVIGAFLVWVPLVIYLILAGHWPQAIGLAAYCAIIVSQSDNVFRFMLQKKMADTHPLITIFGVIIGISMFGFMGIIFGPVMIALFVLCVKIFKEEYLDGKTPVIDPPGEINT